MKFTEKQAVEALRAKMTVNGEKLQLSERTLENNVKRYFSKFVTEETELDSFITEVLPDFKEFEGNARKDYSDFVKSYKPKEEPKTEGEKTPKDDSQYANLVAEFETLKGEFNKQKSEKTIAQKKSDLKTAIKNSGVKDSKWIDSVLSLMTINEDVDIASESAKLTQLYNTQMSEYTPNITPNSGNGGSPSAPDFSDIAQIIKRNNGEV